MSHCGPLQPGWRNVAFLRLAGGSGLRCRSADCWRRPSLSRAQARRARETDVTVALTLRRTGLSSPAYRDWLDYVIVEDGRDVGRLYEDRHSRPEYRWFWSITVYVNPARGIVTSGRASTIEEAKAQFLANWEKCGGDSSPGRASVCP
jgi:hypothetical protein